MIALAKSATRSDNEKCLVTAWLLLLHQAEFAERRSLMYALNDTYNNLLFRFNDDGSIVGSSGELLGSVRDGVVCDLDGNPTRVTVNGYDVVWHGANPGPVVRLYGVIVFAVGENVPAGIVVGAATDAERMIAAVAYWEFVLSET
jgi:hypothetical protein